MVVGCIYGKTWRVWHPFGGSLLESPESLNKSRGFPTAIPHPWKQLIRKEKRKLGAGGFITLLHPQERAQIGGCA